jgi:hypothetical protein
MVVFVVLPAPPADPLDDRRSPGTIAMSATSTGTATATTHQYFRGTLPPSATTTLCDTPARE